MELRCPHCHKRNRLPPARLADLPRCGACRSALLEGRVIELDAGNFGPMTEQAPRPVLVDFWAPWCTPCRQFAPTYAATAQGLSERYVFAKLDTEAEPALAGGLGIRSIPTLVLFRDGREVSRRSGALSGPELRRWLLAQE